MPTSPSRVYGSVTGTSRGKEAEEASARAKRVHSPSCSAALALAQPGKKCHSDGAIVTCDHTPFFSLLGHLGETSSPDDAQARRLHDQ